MIADIEDVYAALGRKTLELEQIHAEYDRLLALLAGVLAGEIAPERVRVDLVGRCWALDVSTDDMPLSASAKVGAGHINGVAHTDAKRD